jgi:hypothetical protein
MKWLNALFLLAVVAFPAGANAQEVLPIGNIPQINDPAPSLWAYSGYEILNVRAGVGNVTPIMRSETYDARLVEILSRTQAPPLRSGDIKSKVVGNHHYITVRNFLLLEVMPEDAHADGSSIGALTNKWVNNARYVLPKVSPASSRFGI